MNIRQIKNVRRLLSPTSDYKHNQRTKKGLIFALSALLFAGGIWGQTSQAEDVSAWARDSYIQGKLKGAYNNNASTYTYRGYYSVWGGANSTYHKWGRFDDTIPGITVNDSLYNPDVYTYESYPYIDMYQPMSDWGFVPGITSRWHGKKYYVSSGPSNGRGWQRSVRVDYTRHKTTPKTRGVSVSGYDYKSGNNYWVKKGNSVKAKVHGSQNFNGTKWRWKDYVRRNYINMVGHGKQIKGQMEYTGSYSNTTTHSDITISGSGASRQNNNRDLYTTFNVKGNKHATTYEFKTYARSANGKSDGYDGTGKYLKVDGEKPTDHGAKVTEARYVNGNDHWIRPGESVVVNVAGYDKHSRLKNSNIRIYSSGHDNRARHSWPDKGLTEYHRNGTYTDITGGKVVRWGWTSYYDFTVRANTNSGNRTYNIDTYHKDNVGYIDGWNKSDQRIRTDATAPTISASPGTRGWDNSNMTVSLNHSDGQSGIKTKQYKWSKSRSTPSSWDTYSGSVTQSSNGTWYLHARAVDNVGRVTTERFGPYRIDKTAPTGSISQSPTSWTKGNVTLSISASDTGGSSFDYMKLPNGVTASSSSATYQVTSNGTYSFTLYDMAGNSRTVSHTVTNIDKTAPTDPKATIFGARYVNGNDHWIRPGDDVRIYVEGYDDESLMRNTNLRLYGDGNDNRAEYRWYARPTDVREYQTTGGYTSIYDGSEYYWDRSTVYDFGVRANTNAGNRLFNVYTYHRDNADNNTGWVDSGLNLRTDATAPTISANTSSRGWGKGNVSVTLTHNDGQSGIKTKQYKWSTSKSTPSSWSTYSSSLTQTNQGIWYLHARAVDNVDRVTTKRFGPYKIDKTAPSGSIAKSPSSWTNGNVTLMLSTSDSGGSGYYRTKLPNGSYTTSTSPSYTATSNGKYSFVVYDKAGNSKTVSTTVSNIDRIAPSGSISQSPTSWTNGNVTLTFNATDSGGSGVKRVRVAGGSWVNGSTTSRTVSSNGTYSFEVQDHAGNLKTVSRTVSNIDKSLPNASSKQSPTAWTKGNVTITWNASATGSPLSRIRVHNGSTWGAWSSVSGTTASTTQTVTANDTYHFQVEDQAGNVRQISRTVKNIDRTPPNASSKQSPTGWTNGNVTITWAANVSSQSPLQQVRTHNGSAWGSWTTISGTSRTQTQVVSSNGTYHFQVRDTAGNVRQISRTVSNIDKGAPAIKSSQSPTAWTKGNVTLTLGARDYGEGNGQNTHISGIASIQVKRPNGTTWSDTYGSPSEHSETYYNRTFTATENGTYTVTVTDRAGNKATHTHTVSNIDRSKPTGSTNRQSGWTNGNVWIDVTGRDVDGGLASIKHVSGGTISGTTSYPFTGTTSSQTVRFIATQNGTYAFDITDRAGNVHRVTQVVDTIDRTVPYGATTQTPTAWTNQDITIDLGGGDNNDQGPRISGVDRVRMRPVGAGSWSETRTVSDSTESSPNFNSLAFTITKNGRYQFEIRDRAGNTRMVEHTVTNIDRMLPTTSGSFAPNGWTNDPITITWKAERTGDPGAPLEAYRYDRGNGNWTGWQNAKHADAFTVTQQVTENGVYRFDIRDEAGNVARSSVTVTKHDIVLPVGQITARYDRSERDDHIGYTSNDLVNMVDDNRVTVDVTGVEDLGISGVDFVTIEEQHRIGYGSDWMTVREIDYDWPDPYDTTSQTYDIDVAHAQDTRFILTVTDRAGNESRRVASNVVRQSVLQAVDFRITDVVNPQLTEEDLDEIRASDLTEGVVDLTAGTDVTFDVTYQLRHLDTVDKLSGEITIKTISDDRTHTHVIDVEEDTTGHNRNNTFTKTFTVPQGTPKGSEITIVGNLKAEMANGTTHEISYPSTADIGVIENHIEEFFRFRIVR